MTARRDYPRIELLFSAKMAQRWFFGLKDHQLDNLSAEATSAVSQIIKDEWYLGKANYPKLEWGFNELPESIRATAPYIRFMFRIDVRAFFQLEEKELQRLVSEATGWLADEMRGVLNRTNNSPKHRFIWKGWAQTPDTSTQNHNAGIASTQLEFSPDPTAFLSYEDSNEAGWEDEDENQDDLQEENYA